MRSKNPSVIAHVLRPEPTIVDEEIAPTEEKHKDNRPIGEKVISALVGIFSKDESDDNDTVKRKIQSLLRIIQARRTKKYSL